MDLTNTNLIFDWTDDGEGVLVLPADLANFIANIDNPIGFLIGSLLGGPNGLPAEDYLTVAATGGMTLGIGGSRVFCQGRPIDTIPATAFTVPPNSSGQPRFDLIAIAATRVPGSSAVTRNVLGSGGVPPMNVVSGTLVAGTATISLGATYSVAPACFPSPQGSDSSAVVNVTSVSDTDVTVTSSDSADTRTVQVFVFGDPDGSTGTPTTIYLEQNTAAFSYVTGTPGSGTPAPPSGYESFATVSVTAGTTSITAADIDILFPQIPALSNPLNLLGLTSLGLIAAGDGLNDGILSYFGTAVGLGTVSPADVLKRLLLQGTTSGGAIWNAQHTTALIYWDNSGNLWINGNLVVGGNIVANGSITAGGGFIGSGGGLTGIPLTALKSLPTPHAWGLTPASYTSGDSATITLPNDGNTYDVMVRFTVQTHLGTITVASPSGSFISGSFAAVIGSGYTDATEVATAACKAIGAGQTLSFALAQSFGSGGYSGDGLWEVTAFLIS
jgi:hypothetical protein